MSDFHNNYIRDGVGKINLAGVNSDNELKISDSTGASTQAASLTKLTEIDTAIDGVATTQTDKTQMTQITDGTEELAINASNEALVKDTDTLAKLGDIENNQTDGTQASKITDGSVIANVEQSVDEDTNLDGDYGLVVNGIHYMRINSTQVKPARMDASTHTIQTMTYAHHEIHDNCHFFLEDYTTLGNGSTLDFCVTTDDSLKWDHLTFGYSSSLLLTLDVYIMTDWTENTGTLVVPFANNHAKSEWGTHTSGTSATVMTDSTASFTVDALIGDKIYNVTDGSYGIITDNDATTVTVASLVGGTGNNWETNDYYHINSCLTKIETDATVVSVGMKIGGSKGGDGTNPSQANSGTAGRDNEWVLDQNQSYLFRFTSGAASNIVSYSAEFYRHTDND